MPVLSLSIGFLNPKFQCFTAQLVNVNKHFPNNFYSGDYPCCFGSLDTTEDSAYWNLICQSKLHSIHLSKDHWEAVTLFPSDHHDETLQTDGPIVPKPLIRAFNIDRKKVQSPLREENVCTALRLTSPWLSEL